MTKHVIDCGPFSSVLIGTKSHHIIGNAVFGIPALTSARKAVGFLLLPILFALVGLLALTATQVYGQSTVPSKPASFSATAGDSRVTISWNDPNAPTITKYQYRRSIDAGNNWSPNWAELPGSGASTVTHVFNDVVPGLTYVVQIRAVNINGNSEATDRATVTPTMWTAKFTARRSSQTSAVGFGPDLSDDGHGSLTKTSFKLRGTEYQIRELHRDLNDTDLTLQLDNNLPADLTTSFTLTANGSSFPGSTATRSYHDPPKYEWADSGVDWADSPTIMHSVSLLITAAPGQPADFDASVGRSQVALSWDDPGDPAITKYQYRQSADGEQSWSPDWTDVSNSDKGTTSHMVSGLTIGTEHTFSVRAVNDAGNGSAASITITPGEDLDDDDDGLIQVSNEAQLNALRWDLDGDGSSTDAGYATAFPTARTGMGCPEPGCISYELTTDLDFDTNGDGVVDSADNYWNDGAGWEPIVRYVDPGEGESRVTHPFNAAFDGGGHTVSNLFINRATDNIGLFGVTGSGSVVRNVGLPFAKVTGKQGVGALVGRVASGKITGSFSTGSVTGTSNDVGGLVGRNNSGSIAVSYSTAAVSGDTSVGGLVGYTEEGSITASYATGSASGNANVGGLVGKGGSGSVQASYAIGPVKGTFSDGLVGYGGATISDSYWNTETTDTTGAGGRDYGKTTDELKSPTAYGDGDDDGDDIYANWNVDVDGDDSLDDPWDFGTNQQYPALKIDFNGDNDATWQEFGFQRAMAGFTATAGNLQVTISWEDFGDPAVSHFEVRQSDDDGDTWTTWETISGSDATTTDHTISGLTNGVAYTFQIRPVKDYGAGLASESITATPAAPNASPRVVAPIADQALTVGDSTTTLDLSSNFSDPDGNLLSYSASSSNPSVVTASTSGSQLTLTPVAAGTAAVTVNAVDPSGAGVSDQFSVTVSGSAPDEEEEPPTTPEPTAPPTVPAPPPPTAQEILTLFEENPEQAGEVVGQLADDDPEEAGRVISESAEEDEQAAGQIICSAVDGHSASMGRAVGHAAKANAGSTSNALGTISDDGDCVGQLGSVIPVEPWLPEQAPPEGQDQTGQGTWQDVGSPAPVENVMARFFTPIEDAHTDITNLDEPRLELNRCRRTISPMPTWT